MTASVKHPAVQFLEYFGEDFFIQTFDDKKKGNRTALTERRIKSLEEFPRHISSLTQLNMNQNAGVYFCVNDLGENKRRVSDNITAVRAFFVDLDGSPLGPVVNWRLPPNIVVQTSADRFHAYWLLDDNYPDAIKLFKPIQRWLADKFNGDRAVNDLCRVMRIPGFNNMKHDPFKINFKIYHERPYKLKQITEAFDNARSENPANNKRNTTVGLVLPADLTADILKADAGRGGLKNMAADLAFSAERLRGALLSISADDYETWLRVGMALQGSAMRDDAEMSVDEAYEYWLSWSQLSPKFDESVMEQKWQGLNARGEVGLGTVFELAQQQGWKGAGARSWSIDEWIKNEEQSGRIVARVKIDMTTPEGRAQAARYGIK